MSMLSDGDRLSPLSREVLPPREALCGSCLSVEMRLRRGGIMRAGWILALTVIIVMIAHFLGTWPW